MGIGHEERRPVRLVGVRFARAALAVALEQLREHGERFVGIVGPLEGQAHEVHPGERRRDSAGIVDREHALVADRDAVLVHPVLEAPHPCGP